MAKNKHPNSEALPPFAIALPADSQRLELALPAPPPTGAATQPLTFVRLMRSLRRRWPMAVGVGFGLASLTAVAVWYFLPPSKPFAFAKIEFPSNPERVLNEHPDPPLKEQTQKERILSRKMLSKVLEQPQVAELQSIREQPDPIAYLARELTIDFAAGSEIMRITLHGDRPGDLEIIVNAVKDTYLHEVSDESERRRNNKENDLRVRYARAESEYRKALDEAIKSGIAYGGGDPQTVAAMRRRVEEQRDDAESNLATARAKLEKLNRDLKSLQAKLANPINFEDPEHLALFQPDEELQLLAKQRRDAENRLASRRPLVAPDHQSLKDIEAEIRVIQDKTNARRRQIQPQFEARLLVKINADITRLQEDVAEWKAAEQKLVTRINKLSLEAKEFGDTSAKAQGTYKLLSALRDDADSIDRALKKLMTERDVPIRAKELEAAIVVMPNESWRRVRFAGLAFIGVFGTVLLGFAFAEYRARRIASAEEVASGLGMTVIGTVPTRPARLAALPPLGPPGPDQALWEHLINESVDSTRTIFLHTADANALRVVQITSAVGREGKTMLSSQLARSLARSGRRVLLIDGDLRSPAAHSLFGATLEPGLCDLLRGTASKNAVRSTPTPSLFFLPAGRCDTLALQHMAMDGLRDLLNDFRGTYDFILIDSSPVLPVADALLMARHVDGVLLSIMCDVSQFERIQTASQKLVSVGARIIGTVLHGADDDNYGYGQRIDISRSQAIGV